MGQRDSHFEKFTTTKLKAGEKIHGNMQGWIGGFAKGPGNGRETHKNGQLIVTNERVCFYRKGFFGEVFETIPLSKITSVETRSVLGYRNLRIHTSHDELTFKTFEGKQSFDEVYENLEHLRHPPATKPASEATILDQIAKLGELKAAGVLTEDEFAAKKATLLDRI